MLVCSNLSNSPPTRSLRWQLSNDTKVCVINNVVLQSPMDVTSGPQGVTPLDSAFHFVQLLLYHRVNLVLCVVISLISFLF